MVKNHGLPMSYLQIQTVEEGTEWYKANTKYPDEVCEMLAKYEWGDLKYTTTVSKKFRCRKIHKYLVCIYRWKKPEPTKHAASRGCKHNSNPNRNHKLNRCDLRQG